MAYLALSSAIFSKLPFATARTGSSWGRFAAGSLRLTATPQYRSLGHALDDSCQHSEAGALALHELFLQSGVDLPYRAIKTNIGDSLNVVVQLERRPGRRFVSEVLEIIGYDPDADLYNFRAVHVPRQDQP
jgi:hypothetical protein